MSKKIDRLIGVAAAVRYCESVMKERHARGARGDRVLFWVGGVVVALFVAVAVVYRMIELGILRSPFHD